MIEPKISPKDETAENRIKRLYMRSIRRGIKEMDLILQAFATDRLAQMQDADLSLYDAMLSENDHDLYQWVTGQVAAPNPYGPLVADIQGHIASRTA